MKKLFYALLVLCASFIVSACSSASKHEHQFGEWTTVQELTCGQEGVKERVCSCGEKETEKTPATGNHKYESEVLREPTAENYGIIKYTCSVCGHSYQDTIDKIDTKWFVDYYVDEFGDKTTDAYVAGVFSGTFTASIARDAKQDTIVYLDKKQPNMTQIRCLKYGSSRPSYDKDDTAVLKVKLDNGNTKSYDLVCYDGEFWCEDSGLVSDIFGNKEVNCVITVYEKYNFDDVDDTYKFKIETAGLSELYEKTK